MKAIFERRSIRKYLNRQIPKESIKEILRAGLSAPSAGNAQPWQFIVLEEKSIMHQIPEIQPSSQMLKQASHAIVVCGDMTLKNKFVGELWIQDCSAATENMLIMAQDLGLGAVWLGVYPMKEIVEGIKQLLGLPDHIIPFSIVSLGYPAEKKDASDRCNEARVHWNQW